jgi:signal transduction histidine kinase
MESNRINLSSRNVITLAWAATAIGLLISVLGSGSQGPGRALALVPVAVLAAWGVPRARAWILAGAALPLAALATDEPALAAVVAALVFASIVTDRARSAWVGWAGGLLGAGFGFLFLAGGSSSTFCCMPEGLSEAEATRWLAEQGATAAPTAGALALPFVAVVLGGALAVVVRLLARTAALAQHADELRTEHDWLEQRTAVARELHDVVGHHVTAMVVQAEAGQVRDHGSALGTIADLGRTALGELDSLVVHLRDPAAKVVVSAPPRLTDIDELLAEPLRRQGIDVKVSVGSDLDLTEPQLLALYRVTQEAVTNVARHARARHVWISLEHDGGTVRLQVRDDGIGPPSAQTRGSGLVGIRERVAGLGETWSLRPGPGGGAQLDVRIPATHT